MVCFIACLKYRYSDILLDPTGTGMWLFHPRIAELRKSNNFLVKILVHRDSEVADRREGLVLIDENPLTHPIPITTPANVAVRYEIGKKNEVRVESLPVDTLGITLPTQKERHAVIRGKGVGDIVIYVKSAGPKKASVRKETERRGGFELAKADMCVLQNS